MDAAPAGIESELLDLSTINVSNLRGVELADLREAITRVQRRIVDAEQSISGYNGNGTVEGTDGIARPSSEG
jgi:hypothetical protein